MESQFADRILSCSDCHGDFVFTAGEQLFFYDKQFKNDPKRCKPCKSRRSGLSAVAGGAGGTAAAGLCRTETRTDCSDCGIETTVPFKPTQGRPVLCRQCFQVKAKAGAKLALATVEANPIETATALASASLTMDGACLSPDEALLAAASMAGASAHSSVASAADLASITPTPATPVQAVRVPVELVAAAQSTEAHGGIEAPEA